MQLIPSISPYANGWRLTEGKEVLPVWFKGTQLPPSCTRKKPKDKKTLKPNDGYDADIDNKSDEPMKKKKRKSKLPKTGPGHKFRKELQNIVKPTDPLNEHSLENDEITIEDMNLRVQQNPISERDLSENSGYDATVTEGDLRITDEEEFSDGNSEWEHYSDFAVTESSSGSDWM